MKKPSIISKDIIHLSETLMRNRRKRKNRARSESSNNKNSATKYLKEDAKNSKIKITDSSSLVFYLELDIKKVSPATAQNYSTNSKN